jgi:hypothetical protein
MAECEANVKYDGENALCSGATARMLGASAAAKLS